MATFLKEVAQEESAYVVTVTFKDSNNAAVAPSAATWTLTTPDGTVVNSREDVAISSPTSSEDIVLSGDDLAWQGTGSDDHEILILTVEATYTASELDGSPSLPIKESVMFYLRNMAAVS
jgi:hypothetical protein